MDSHVIRFCLGFSISMMVVGCCESAEVSGVGGSAPTTTSTGTGTAGAVANARFKELSGSGITGDAKFDAMGQDVTLTVTIEGASPGVHGIHIHENDDCSTPSAPGAHWNPYGTMHGRFGQGQYHLGDIGNINVDANGHGEKTLVTKLWSVGSGSPSDVVGHSIVVHEDEDDYISQPSGNSGAAIACGEIAIQE